MINLENRRKEIVIETNELGCELIVSHTMSKDGHVQLKVDGKLCKAHRLAYEQKYGSIPEGLVVRHKCDNPNCINPEHLELGTHEDNVSDRVKRNRSARGTNNGRSKLTEEDVIFIRNNSTYNNSELSRMFNVDPKTIREIKKYIIWKHVVDKCNK